MAGREEVAFERMREAHDALCLLVAEIEACSARLDEARKRATLALEALDRALGDGG